jgi:hypothetical protein
MIWKLGIIQISVILDRIMKKTIEKSVQELKKKKRRYYNINKKWNSIFSIYKKKTKKRSLRYKIRKTKQSNS